MKSVRPLRMTPEAYDHLSWALLRLKLADITRVVPGKKDASYRFVGGYCPPPDIELRRGKMHEIEHRLARANVVGVEQRIARARALAAGLPHLVLSPAASIIWRDGTVEVSSPDTDTILASDDAAVLGVLEAFANPVLAAHVVGSYPETHQAEVHDCIVALLHARMLVPAAPLSAPALRFVTGDCRPPATVAAEQCPWRLTLATTAVLGAQYVPDRKVLQIDLRQDAARMPDDAAAAFGSSNSVSLAQLDRFFASAPAEETPFRLICLNIAHADARSTACRSCHAPPESVSTPLHAQLGDVLRRLGTYHSQHGSDLALLGAGPAAVPVLERTALPVAVRMLNRREYQPWAPVYGRVPIDAPAYAEADYANACELPALTRGPTLNRYGYYPCGVAAEIDAILGFDVGIKRCAHDDDDMHTVLRIICPYCAFFRYKGAQRETLYDETMNERELSPSWQTAFDDYARAQPILTEI